MKRAFIIHGWSSNSEDGWFPWLKLELEKEGFQVTIPTMPNTDSPDITEWVNHLKQIALYTDDETVFVGHSIGCQTILRYLEGLESEAKVRGAVFVGGWFTLMNLETEDEKTIAHPWLETPINFDLVKQHTKNFTAIFSDTDPVVPLENKDLFEVNLNAQTIVENDKGHFTGSEGVVELPSVLKAVLDL